MSLICRELIGICLLLFLVFVFIRAFISGEINYQLNLSALKKRRKLLKESPHRVMDWFLYRKYRDVIPSALLIFYFIVLGVHPIAFVACCLLEAIKATEGYGLVLVKGVMWFDILWFYILNLLFCTTKPGFKYDRWIQKKRGMKKK